jgi:hypothetical protein
MDRVGQAARRVATVTLPVACPVHNVAPGRPCADDLPNCAARIDAADRRAEMLRSTRELLGLEVAPVKVNGPRGGRA